MHDGRVRVFGCVRERFRHDVEGGHFDLLRQPAVAANVELDGNRGATYEGLKAAWRRPSVRIAGWIACEISRSSSSAPVSPSRICDNCVWSSRGSRGASASAARTSSVSDTSRCCAPSWRSRCGRRPVSSLVATTRALEAMSSARVSAFEMAVATSCVNSAMLRFHRQWLGVHRRYDHYPPQAPRRSRLDCRRTSELRTHARTPRGLRSHPRSCRCAPIAWYERRSRRRSAPRLSGGCRRGCGCRAGSGPRRPVVLRQSHSAVS